MYFNKVFTLEELKKQYYKLCFLHHPDKGGNTVIMQAINAEYQERLYQLSQQQENETDRATQEDIGEQFKEQIQKIITVPGIKIEICGTWIWISGNTYPIKDKLKEADFYFAGQKKMWYWRPPEYKRRNKKTMSMEWIRGTYGSTKIDTEEIPSLGT